MNKVILPVFFPIVNIVRESDIDGAVRLSIRKLCEQAGIPCRVTGQAAERQVVIRETEQNGLIVSRATGEFGSVCVSTNNLDPLFVLGVLAYGVNDYAARETVCGRGLFCVQKTLGRPRTGRALLESERKRKARSLGMA
jgi:hypothetical protein